MGFREVSVYEIKEVLRLWLLDCSFREITRKSGTDSQDRSALRVRRRRGKGGSS